MSKMNQLDGTIYSALEESEKTKVDDHDYALVSR